jgi:hypothetical protein
VVGERAASSTRAWRRDEIQRGVGVVSPPSPLSVPCVGECASRGEGLHMNTQKRLVLGGGGGWVGWADLLMGRCEEGQDLEPAERRTISSVEQLSYAWWRPRGWGARESLHGARWVVGPTHTQPQANSRSFCAHFDTHARTHTHTTSDLVPSARHHEAALIFHHTPTFVCTRACACVCVCACVCWWPQPQALPTTFKSKKATSRCAKTTF